MTERNVFYLCENFASGVIKINRADNLPGKSVTHPMIQQCFRIESIRCGSQVTGAKFKFSTFTFEPPARGGSVRVESAYGHLTKLVYAGERTIREVLA